MVLNSGPVIWEYWRRVVLRCKEGAIGSRTTGLELTYNQFLITLFLKGLKEADRGRIHQRFMNYDASFEEIEEVAKALEQNAISLKASPAKSKGMVNTTSSSNCTKCKRPGHTTQNCMHKYCSLCDRPFHAIEECYLNPKYPGYKGDAYAIQYWDPKSPTQR